MSRAQFEAGVSSREAALLHQAREGDRGAYAQIVTAYQDRLYNAILRIVGSSDEAADLTQETFTRGLEKIESFRGDSQPYTWLFRIGINLALSQLRKVQRKRVFSLDRPAVRSRATDDQASGLVDRLNRERSLSPAETALRQERDEQVLAAMGRLDAENRALVVMRDVEGFDYQQMADVLELPLGTLKSKLFRARLALRDELKDYFQG